MAYKSRDFILPRPPKADWQPPAEQAAWRLREEIVRQEETERAAVEAAREARKAAEAEATATADAKAAADKMINSKADQARRNYSIGAHFDG
ncbi:hypothetical protein [Mesorhizobium sp. WSM4887]|uniref:hypothetical protein n=1 Tax=Mesorhizobium sp. WSM4887 TaxID=3038543 RepID=UPI0024170E8E|nr:hypothetical protein [Mesorhizobium sp. WSM4887]MDG4890918.1 hypothetical protein [Mesorhizobium sp. WSM4887]